MLISRDKFIIRALPGRFQKEKMEKAVAAVILEGKDVTYDLKPNRDDPTAVVTQEMAQAICDKMA